MFRQIDVPGGTLAASDVGDPSQTEGVPLLVHGVGYSLDVWAAVAERLAPHTRVVSLDLRGHGWSTAESSSADDVWQDVAVCVEELGLERPILVGHDTGAYVVTAAEAQTPGLASGILAVDWVTPLSGTAARDWLAEITGDDMLDFLAERFALGASGPDEASRREFLEGLVARVGEDWMTAETGPAHARAGLDHSTSVADDGSWVRRPTRAEVAWQARVPADSPVFPAAELYERISCPMWFVHADDGPYADLLPGLERLADRPERRVVRLDAGHHVEQTHPDEVARVVLDLRATLGP